MARKAWWISASAFVADEQAMELVQPGEGALDDPAVTAEAGAVIGGAAGDHWFDPALTELATVTSEVVAAIGDELFGSAAGPADEAAHGRYRSTSGIIWVTSWRLPPVRVKASGIPPWSTMRWCLDPGVHGQPGSGPSWRPPFRLYVTGVDDGARPLELTGGTQSLEQQAVQLHPHPGTLPLIQAPLAGDARAEPELRRKVPPSDPGVEYEQDPRKRLPIWMAAASDPDATAASWAATARSAPTTRPRRSTAQRPSAPLPA